MADQREKTRKVVRKKKVTKQVEGGRDSRGKERKR